MLLIVAFFTSYILQQQKVTAVHETVVSIFAGKFSLSLSLSLSLSQKESFAPFF